MDPFACSLPLSTPAIVQEPAPNRLSRCQGSLQHLARFTPVFVAAHRHHHIPQTTTEDGGPAQLEKEPDGCIINEVGRCVSIAGNYDVSLDFRVVVSGDISNERSPINSQKVTQPPRNLTDQHTIHIELEFPAVNTSYCEANDALFSADQLAGGGFIYGTEGCVFIEVCEIPSWVYVVGGSDCFGLSAADYNDPSEENHGDGNGDNPQYGIAAAKNKRYWTANCQLITHRWQKRRSSFELIRLGIHAR
ncbi:hypothetical protein PC119_g22451 [Phytophthora cactorum]|nr:hypothetical protein PC119_g22451 [Phytophthora cactorum]KAG3176729.1 hypothetical protein PC128_g17183 [Phytophthora cactorum]